MDFKVVEQLSEAGGKGNEDAYGAHVHGNRLDIWIIDGATSIAETEHLGLEISDPAWFAQSLNTELGRRIAEDPDPGEAIRDSIMTIRAEYETRIKGKKIPWHEKPLASLVWLRAVARGDAAGADGADLRIMAMGDSRFLVARPDSIRLFPAEMRGDAAPSPVRDAASDEARNRTGVLLSHLAGEKARREQYHTNPTMGILGFDPRSVDYARREHFRVSGAFGVLAMSDGFYRLVDEYSLYTDETLWSAAGKKGLKTLYEELRTHEQAAEARKDYAVKRRDDATAIHITYS